MQQHSTQPAASTQVANGVRSLTSQVKKAHNSTYGLRGSIAKKLGMRGLAQSFRDKKENQDPSSYRRTTPVH